MSVKDSGMNTKAKNIEIHTPSYQREEKINNTTNNLPCKCFDFNVTTSEM